MSTLRDSRDYFAELYVAGRLGDAGWSIYFPKRDVGFDFVATKKVHGEVLIRPVQVKGKYPKHGRAERRVYGYIGKLTQLHPEMVLAIPYFSLDKRGAAPVCTAYMPRWQIRTQTSRGYACQPAQFRNGAPSPRRDFQRYFDFTGIESMELVEWSRSSDATA